MQGAALLLLIEVAGPALPASDDERGCAGGASGIVVCGKTTSPDRYRVPSSSATVPDDPALPRAETGLIGNARIGVTTEQASLGGVPSNRVMVRLRIPLGGRR